MEVLRQMWRATAAYLGCCAIAWAETGGLTELPYPIGFDTTRPSIVTNGNFSGTDGWRLANSHSFEPSISRTGDGSGSLRLANIGTTETVSSTQFSLAANGFRRVFRLKAWLRANHPLPAGAQFRIYLSDATHGGVIGCGTWVELSALGVDQWREYTTDLEASSCMYKHFQDIHAKDTITLDVRGRNIPADTSLYVDDITFEPVVRELVLFPTYPNYRGMLWDDQGSEIQMKAVIDPPQGYTIEDLAVAVDIVRASDGEVLDQVALSELSPIADSGPWIGYSVSDLSYEASGLPDAVYYLRGRLRRKSDQQTLYTYPDYKIVKQPASRRTWKVWVDRHNRPVINGKPTFLWGTYARFTASRNTFLPETRGNRSNPDTYKSIANGCATPGFSSPCSPSIPAFTPWARGYGKDGSTFFRQMADVNMNALTIHADYGTFNIGFNSPVAGNKTTGRITSQGNLVTGDEQTKLGSDVYVGDTLVVTRDGTGQVSSSGSVVTGVNTRFLSEIQPGDFIDVPGGGRYVNSVQSDTTLIVTGTTNFTWRDTAFKVVQYRRILDLNGQVAILDAPYLPDIQAPTTFAFERCSPAGYNAGADWIGALISALGDFNISYWHLASNIQGVNAPYWSFSPYQPKCHLVSREDSARFISTFSPRNSTEGFLGFYMADEPPYADPKRGLESVWQIQRGQSSADVGGLNFWVDGAIPVHAFDQWNTISDAIVPDPYPATGDNLPTYDDFAFGLSSWNKHGRSYFWPRRSASAVFDSRPMINSLQLFSWYASQGLAYSTFPQLSDMKIQLVSSVAAGATGMLWWHMGSGSISLGDRGEEDYLRFRRASKVVADLLPVLSEPIQDLAGRTDGKPEYGSLVESVSDPEVRCSSRRRGTDVLLACVNTTNSDKTVTIVMKQPIEGDVRLPWNDTLLPSNGTRFQAQFRGLHGGTQIPGSGTLSVSGQKVTCTSTCRFTSELAPRHTVTSGGRTRLVLSVESDSEFTIDSGVGTAWEGKNFVYSSDLDKEKSAHFFLLSMPATAPAPVATMRRNLP